VATSQNGWTVLDTAPPPTTVPGTDIELHLRPGDCSFLLTRVAGWFHKNIEPLDMPVREEPGYDDWGWAKRPVRGQIKGYSNHASGTAEDLNATQHPRGVKGTFSQAEKDKVHAHLREYRDPVTGKVVIRWGEDYSGTIDGMHFEVVGDEEEVARVVKLIKAAERVAAEGVEDDMFLAGVAGPDKRVFLCGVEGKRVVNKEQYLTLTRAGIRDVGEFPSTVLQLFPTLPNSEAPND
jgi:hypothetical protein